MEQHSSDGGPGVARSANAVYIVPADWSASTSALAAAIDRVDLDVGATQLLIIVASADAAVAVTQALTAAGGRSMPRIVAATGAGRAARVLKAGNAPIVVGAPEQLLALLRMSALKLDEVRALAVAWLEDILATGRGEDLEAILAEVPRTAARIVMTSHWDALAEDFVERHARRAPMVQLSHAGPVADAAENKAAAGAVSLPETVAYVTCPPSGRASALQMVLDEIDPPSALVYVRSNEGEREVRDLLHALGYDDQPSVRLTRGDITEHASLVILYDLPHTPGEWRGAIASQPGRVVALIPPRLVRQLRTLAEVPGIPLSFSAPLDAARAREAQLRADLRRELAAGTPARELLTLEPLLSEYDGAALAAAALRLLDHERTNRARAESAAVAHPPREATRDERPRDQDRDRPKRDRDRRDAGDRSGTSRSAPGGRREGYPPGRSGGGRGDSRGRPSDRSGDSPRGGRGDFRGRPDRSGESSRGGRGDFRDRPRDRGDSPRGARGDFRDRAPDRSGESSRDPSDRETRRSNARPLPRSPR